MTIWQKLEKSCPNTTFVVDTALAYGDAMRLLELLDADRKLTGRAALTTIASELNHPKPQTVIDGGREILNNLYRHDIVIGTRQGS